MRFTKKPVTIEAWQNYTGDPKIDGRPGLASPAPAWLAGLVANSDGTIRIQTLEGAMLAGVGDWIIRGVKGELYPCKSDIFAATYEVAWTDSFDFGIALWMLIDGRRVRRAGWNGKGMFLFYIPTWTYTDGKQDNYPNEPIVALKTAGHRVMAWTPNMLDQLATDWELAE